jgi:hypothetical protein
LKNGLIKSTKKHKRHTPLESPLNGGINPTIPLLGGVPFYGGEGAFLSFKMARSQKTGGKKNWKK